MSIEPVIMDRDQSTNANLADPGIRVVTNGNPLVAGQTKARLAVWAGRVSITEDCQLQNAE